MLNINGNILICLEHLRFCSLPSKCKQARINPSSRWSQQDLTLLRTSKIHLTPPSRPQEDLSPPCWCYGCTHLKFILFTGKDSSHTVICTHIQNAVYKYLCTDGPHRKHTCCGYTQKYRQAFWFCGKQAAGYEKDREGEFCSNMEQWDFESISSSPLIHNWGHTEGERDSHP